MTDKTRPRVLVLWAYPRSRSTMIERCFLARQDVQTHHEPLSYPYAYGPERAFPDWSDELCASKGDLPTYREAWKRAMEVPEDKTICFVKDMPKFIVTPHYCAATAPNPPDLAKDGNPTYIPSAELLADGIVHAFLIRSPEVTIPSMYKIHKLPGVDWPRFYPDEIGIWQMRKLYDFISSKTPTTSQPLVIESDDVLEDPRGTLKVLCELGGIQYTDAMLDWDATTVRAEEMLAIWPGWHKTVLSSRGIRTDLHQEGTSSLPKELRQLILDNMPDYEYLKSKTERYKRGEVDLAK